MITLNLIAGIFIVAVSIFFGAIATVTYCVSIYVEQRSSDYIDDVEIEDIDNIVRTNSIKLHQDGNPNNSDVDESGFFF